MRSGPRGGRARPTRDGQTRARSRPGEAPGSRSRPSAGLLVERVLAVPAAELLHLDPLTIIDLVLGRDVVTTLADLAGQRDLDPLLVLCHSGSSVVLPTDPACRPDPFIVQHPKW